MKILDFPKLLAKTVFSFMICDGDMSQKEIAFIKNMAAETDVFDGFDMDSALKEMISLINLKGLGFLDDYFKKVKNAKLTEEQEIQVLEAAISTINADGEIKTEEVNFLKILRTVLKCSDDKILDKFPHVAEDFVAKDELTDIYIKELYCNYFKEQTLPTFDVSEVNDITDTINFETE